MKDYLVFFLLVIGISGQKENNKEYGENLNQNEDDYGNPDIYGLIERPCPVYDRFCIRGFFAKNSNCKIVPGPVEDPYYVTELQVYISIVNTTMTPNNSRVRGLNGLIQNFYINKATGNLVLSVFFESLSFDSTVYYRFFRNGKKAVQRTDRDITDYKKLTVTIVIPNYKNLQLDNAEITGYLDDPFPPFIIGPNVSASPDPTARAAITELVADIPAAAKTNLLTIAPLAGKIFVQKNICDFGIAINKVGYN